jgi:hypothetical protein
METVKYRKPKTSKFLDRPVGRLDRTPVYGCGSAAIAAAAAAAAAARGQVAGDFQKFQ